MDIMRWSSSTSSSSSSSSSSGNNDFTNPVSGYTLNTSNIALKPPSVKRASRRVSVKSAETVVDEGTSPLNYSSEAPGRVIITPPSPNDSSSTVVSAKKEMSQKNVINTGAPKQSNKNITTLNTASNKIPDEPSDLIMSNRSSTSGKGELVGATLEQVR